MLKPAISSLAGADRRALTLRRVRDEFLRGLFRLALRAPKGWLLRLTGHAEDKRKETALDHRARFHAWLVGRFTKTTPYDHMEARRPRLLSLGLLEGPAIEMQRCINMEIPGPDEEIPVRLYVPRTATDPAPVLVFFHFGGGVLGDLETSHTACSYFAHHGRCVVLSVGYRLAPEHKFPAALQDALLAVSWARREARRFGWDADRICIGGDSAGGHLAAAASMYLRDEGEVSPYLQLLIYPVLEMDRSRIPLSAHDDSYPLTRKDMTWFTSLYLNTPDDAEKPFCSVARAPSLKGLPPVIFVQAGHDLLFEEGANFIRRLRDEGVPITRLVYPTLPHAFTAMSGGVPAARLALIEIAQQLGQGLGTLSVPTSAQKETINE